MDAYREAGARLRLVALDQRLAESYIAEADSLISGRLRATTYDGSRKSVSDIEARLVADIERADALRQRAMELLAAVDRTRTVCHRSIGGAALWMHVVDRMLWREVAAALGYSESRIRDLVRDESAELLSELDGV